MTTHNIMPGAAAGFGAGTTFNTGMEIPFMYFTPRDAIKFQ